ncbi:MAG TPA: SgcJ/EcaC family oxidoreductase [Pyrinomonadaceae bacterium]|jgi:uncharacterized protein (TIGR02246 family)|nr:SgcJ/EcaC family oxidoreductase [Pyrinomonadaceae bacterium]
MFKNLIFITPLVFALSASALAQNANANVTSTAGAAKGKAADRKPKAAPTPAQGGAQSQASTTPSTRTRRTTPQSSADAAQARAVRDSFDSLVDGIRRADADAVMKLFWNSPQLVLFNNNGSVTKSWDQARSNRQSLYAKAKDVKLDVRDVHVRLLGPAAALVTCLWDQTQTADGRPEHATGRLTIIFQKIGADWKIVHTHTSPDKPSPSNLLPSERTGGADSTTNPPAKP